MKAKFERFQKKKCYY